MLETYLAQQMMEAQPYIIPGIEKAMEDDDSPLFHTDDFRMWCMKVIPCTKRFVHDWTVCPFAHAGEKAVRRDPRTNTYTGIACPDMKKNTACIRGDRCPYAHNVFEYWLHPTRYRTQLCNDGPTCRRSICFFAHSLEQLRVPACKPYVSPEALARASLEAIHQNPHPLGAQLPNAFGPGQHQHQQQNGVPPPLSVSQHAAQQAAMAVLSGIPPNKIDLAQMQMSQSPAMSGSLAGSPHNQYSMLNPQQQHSGMQGGPPETPPAYGSYIPRISEYGSLPRWSDVSTLANAQRMSQRLSQDSRFSSEYNPSSARHSQDYFGAAASSDLYASNNNNNANAVRMSQDMLAHMQAVADHAVQQQYHADTGLTPASSGGFGSATPRLSDGGNYDFPRVLSTPESLGGQGEVSPRSTGTNGGGTGMMMSREESSREMNRCITLTDGIAMTTTVHNNGSTSPGSNRGAGTNGPISEADLAQSLASMKIAMTQQNIASSAGTNHEIVISTLHQILKGAIANQGNGANNGGGLKGDAAFLAQSLLGDLMSGNASVVDAARAGSVSTDISTVNGAGRLSSDAARALDSLSPHPSMESADSNALLAAAAAAASGGDMSSDIAAQLQMLAAHYGTAN